MSSDTFSDNDGMEMQLDLGSYEGERNEHEERHGEGKALLPNGDEYEGEYQNGRRHGYGKYKFVSRQARYEGGYEEDKRSGQGNFWYPDGSVYNGAWAEGQRHGDGTYVYPNGDTYEGEWREGRRHGQGVYTYKQEGIKYNGNWANGKFAENGELITPTFSYVGTFNGEDPIGPGTFRFDVGCEQEGEYFKRRTVVRTNAVREVVHVPVWKCFALYDAPPRRSAVSPPKDN